MKNIHVLAKKNKSLLWICQRSIARQSMKKPIAISMDFKNNALLKHWTNKSQERESESEKENALLN